MADQIRKNELGGGRRHEWGTSRNAYSVLEGRPEGKKGHLENLGIDGKIY